MDFRAGRCGDMAKVSTRFLSQLKQFSGLTVQTARQRKADNSEAIVCEMELRNNKHSGERHLLLNV